MIQIGPHRLSGQVLLAPMAGITDAPFRRVCREAGAALTTSEMLTSDTRLWVSRKSQTRLESGTDEHIRSMQIVGSDPDKLADAARQCVDYGADIIDINMGCPAKKVCNVAAGSALMRDEPLVTAILQRVVAAVSVPVTLKIRTGWDTENRNAVQIARIAEQEGIAMLAVHGRTRACRFSGEAEYSTIIDVKRAVSLPVIANGDIDSAEKAANVIHLTQADGVMIGRAAQGQPWLLTQIQNYLATGIHHGEPQPDEKIELIGGHLDAMYAFYDDYMGVRMARKHLLWYAGQLPGFVTIRTELMKAETASVQKKIIMDFMRALNLKGGLAA